VRPSLRRMMGHERLHRPVVQARLTTSLRKRAGRLHFVRVQLDADGDRSGGEWLATPTPSQSSGVLTSLIRGQGLAVFPLEAEKLEAGDRVAVQVLDPGCFDRRDRGF